MSSSKVTTISHPLQSGETSDTAVSHIKYLYPHLNRHLAFNNEEISDHAENEEKEDIHDSNEDDADYDLFGDGGLIANAPDFFNQSQFLPENYKFVNSMNPTVFVAKIDTSEISDSISGKGKKSEIKGIKDYTQRIARGAVSNLNISKLREWHEAMMYLPLYDMNIDTMELNLDTDKTNLLISAAEKTTEDFMQKYCYSEPPAQVYENVETWLTSLDMIELTYFIAVYSKMRASAISDTKNLKKEAITNNSDDPTVEMIDEYINTLQQLKQYKELLIQGLPAEIPSKFPTQHINVVPDIPADSWVQNVKQEMKNQLTQNKMQLMILQNEIDQARDKIKNLFLNSNKLFSTFISSPKLHQLRQFYPQLQDFVEKIELLKKCEAKIRDLESKLKLPHTLTENDPAQYTEFMQKISMLKNSKLPTPLSELVLKRVDLSRRHLAYESYDKSDKLICTLDFSDAADQKLFVIASVLYKLYTRSSDTALDDLFYFIFPNENLLPASLESVIKLLNQNLLNQLTSFYKIEKLLNMFEKIKNPNSNPNINFDAIFDVIKFNFQHSVHNFVVGLSGKDVHGGHISNAARMNTFKIFSNGHLTAELSRSVLSLKPFENVTMNSMVAEVKKSTNFVEFTAFKPVRK